MDNQSGAQSFWRAACGGLSRLHQLLSVGDPDDESVFRTPPRGTDRTNDAERRIAEARKARMRS